MNETRIDVVDGCDGLTPDMLRGPNRGWGKIGGITVQTRADVPPHTMYFRYFSDPMHD